MSDLLGKPAVGGSTSARRGKGKRGSAVAVLISDEDLAVEIGENALCEGMGGGGGGGGGLPAVPLRPKNVVADPPIHPLPLGVRRPGIRKRILAQAATAASHAAAVSASPTTRLTNAHIPDKTDVPGPGAYRPPPTTDPCLTSPRSGHPAQS